MMMVWIVVGIILAVAFIVIGSVFFGLKPGPSNSTESNTEQIQDVARKSGGEFVSYENQSLGFRIHYPKNWDAGEQDGQPFFKIPGEGTNVVYSSQILTEDATISELIPELKAQIQDSSSTAGITRTITSEGETRMGDEPAYEWNIEQTRQGVSLIATQVWSIKGRKVHIFTLTTAPGSTHDLFYSVFMEMMQTFELL